MTVGVFFLIIIGVALILFVLDLLFAGGAVTMGMISGTCAMLSNPIGQGTLLVLLAILGILVYAVFFR